MDGNKEYIKMSNIEGKIKDIWEELIVKEKLEAIVKRLEEDKLKNKQIIKEELTELWNKSEISIFKQILDKLVIIINNLENKNTVKEEEFKDKDIKAINVIGRLEPVMIDINESKPKLTKGVKRGIESLAELHKLGKF